MLWLKFKEVKLKDLIKLEKELRENFLNNNIYIELDGDITYRIKIENTRFLLNKIGLILSDSKENQFSICFDEVGNINIEERYIEMFFNYDETIKIFT